MTNPIVATAKWLKETLTMKYRKKPVTIEARQLIGPAAEWHAVYQWVEANTLGSFDMNQFWVDPENFAWPESGVSIDARDGRVVIATLEGGHWVNDGDWIIKGWAGEFYSCKPEIFEATYEKDFEEEDGDEPEPDPLDEANHNPVRKRDMETPTFTSNVQFEGDSTEPDPLDEDNHADRIDCDGDRWVWCGGCDGFRMGARHERHHSTYGWRAVGLNEDYGPLTFADDEPEPEPDYGPRPDGCCGHCPPILGGGYDCTCADNPRCDANRADRYDRQGDRWVWCGRCNGFRVDGHEAHRSSYGRSAFWIDAVCGPLTFAPRPADTPTTAPQPDEAHGDAPDPLDESNHADRIDHYGNRWVWCGECDGFRMDGHEVCESGIGFTADGIDEGYGPVAFAPRPAEPDPLDEDNHADRYDRYGDRWAWCDECGGLRADSHEAHKSVYGWRAGGLDKVCGPLTFAPRPADTPTTAPQPDKAHGDADDPARPAERHTAPDTYDVRRAWLGDEPLGSDADLDFCHWLGNICTKAWGEGHRAGYVDGAHCDDPRTALNPYRQDRA